MTQSLKPYENDTIFKTLVAHLPVKDSRKALAKILLEIPNEFDLQFPMGPKDMQIENIISFILRHYKNISANQVKEAIDLNAAHKFEIHIDGYGKLTREFIGKVLSQFVKYRADQKRNLPQPEMELDIKLELKWDWMNLSKSPRFTINTHIPEKWKYLSENRADFDSSINTNRVSELEEHYKEVNRTGMIRVSTVGIEKIWALDAYKSEKIIEYLLKSVKK